jgi:hypothetical protein
VCTLQPNHLGGDLFGRHPLGFPLSTRALSFAWSAASSRAQVATQDWVHMQFGSPPGADVWWLRVGAGVAGLLFARSIMTPTATKATHSDAAAVPSPMTQGRGRTDRGSEPWARTSSRSRCAKAQLEPSSRMHCRRYPRLDFFRFADLPVGRRSAARRHAASRTKLVASSGPRHIPSSQPCRGCESTLSEPTLLLGCYRR